MVWYAAQKCYPGEIFTRYALLGDDIVIADEHVAKCYTDILEDIGVRISTSNLLFQRGGGPLNLRNASG